MALKDEQKGTRKPVLAPHGQQKTPEKTKEAPTEGPNEAPDTDWRRKARKHGSNMNPKRYQKKVQMRDLGEVENRAPATAGAQFSTWKDTPNGASKLGRSPEAEK